MSKKTKKTRKIRPRRKSPNTEAIWSVGRQKGREEGYHIGYQLGFDAGILFARLLDDPNPID